ncbi:MAG: hypothetical protein IH846_02515 [Acidobacteria bacterium]|nr:hypothetical protein [Acidobacteriota bacterium]MCZ6750289.1 hypothetical protein [Acidobacteriota bacterium]
MPELENLRKITNPSKAIELPVCGEELPFVVAIRCNGLQKKVCCHGIEISGKFSLVLLHRREQQ